MDVVEVADIIFCCVSDPKGAKDVRLTTSDSLYDYLLILCV